MGNGQGRPRTGLPAAPRALEPGVALSDVRDLDVVVLRDDAGVPLRLDVSEDPIPSTSGNRRPRDDAPAVEVSYELVSGNHDQDLHLAICYTRTMVCQIVWLSPR